MRKLKAFSLIVVKKNVKPAAIYKKKMYIYIYTYWSHHFQYFSDSCFFMVLWYIFKKKKWIKLVNIFSKITKCMITQYFTHCSYT